MGSFCQGVHVLCQWNYPVQEAGIGVLDYILALGGSVSKEIDRALVQILAVGLFRHYVCLDRTYLPEGSVIDGCIDLHAAGIYHRNQKSILWQLLTSQKHGYAENLEGGDGNEREVASIANSLRRGDTNPESSITAGAFAYGNCVNGNGMAVGKRQGFVNKNSARNGMAGTIIILLMEK